LGVVLLLGVIVMTQKLWSICCWFFALLTGITRWIALHFQLVPPSKLIQFLKSNKHISW